jgi:hypothetical protein
MLVWGALSDERMGLSFARVIVNSKKSVVCTVYFLRVIECVYIRRLQGLCQSRLNTADHAVSLVASATTAV